MGYVKEALFCDTRISISRKQLYVLVSRFKSKDSLCQYVNSCTLNYIIVV